MPPRVAQAEALPKGLGRTARDADKLRDRQTCSELTGPRLLSTRGTVPRRLRLPTLLARPGSPASAHHPSVPSSPHPLSTYTPTHPPRAASETARVAWGTSPGLDWCCSGGMGA